MLVLYGEMLSFDTKEEALRLNPFPGGLLPGERSGQKGLCGPGEETMERFLASLSNELFKLPQAEKNIWCF